MHNYHLEQTSKLSQKGITYLAFLILSLTSLAQTGGPWRRYRCDLNQDGQVNTGDLLLLMTEYGMYPPAKLDIVPAIQNFYGGEGINGEWQSLTFYVVDSTAISADSLYQSGRLLYCWTNEAGDTLSTTDNSGTLGDLLGKVCNGAQYITLTIVDRDTKLVYQRTVPCWVSWISDEFPDCTNGGADLAAFDYDPYQIPDTTFKYLIAK